ncbi:MAG: GntR family transcriptional regulator [Hyphomicrobiaceae bacterium]|nr:GntR family transcriptional regulator [Hyphomicrobiaceae bacterium]
MSTAITIDGGASGSGLAPIAITRKSDAAYHTVRRSIVLGFFRQGEALPEQKIARQLGCSQGTVREAFLKLERDGLVDRQGYGGTIVSSTSIEEVAEMAKIRIQIECAGIERSVQSMSPDIFNALDTLTVQMDRATRDSDYYLCSELDRNFHLTLFRQSGLASLEPILIRCQLNVHRFTYHLADDLNSDLDLGDIHRELLKTLKSSTPRQAASVMRSHIEDVLERCAPELGQKARR